MIHRNEEELHELAKELQAQAEGMNEHTENWAAQVTAARNGQMAMERLVAAKNRELVAANARINELERELERVKQRLVPKDSIEKIGQGKGFFNSFFTDLKKGLKRG